VQRSRDRRRDHEAERETGQPPLEHLTAKPVDVDLTPGQEQKRRQADGGEELDRLAGVGDVEDLGPTMIPPSSSSTIAGTKSFGISSRSTGAVKAITATTTKLKSGT